MFFGKLWVRIKGELLSVRDKVSPESDLPEKPDELLEAAENRVRTLLRDSGTQETAATKTHDFRADQEPADTTQSRNQKQIDTYEPEPRGPNPRTLG